MRSEGGPYSMGLDEFKYSEGKKQDCEETADAEFKNCPTEALFNPEGIDTPERVCSLVSSGGPLATMDLSPRYFPKDVSEDVKDRAKKESFTHLDRTGSEPVTVLIGDPEEYGDLVGVFGLEDYLQKRLNGTV
mgnify:CR=1 FL=1